MKPLLFIVCFYFCTAGISFLEAQFANAVLETRYGSFQDCHPGEWRTKKGMSKLKFEDIQIYDLSFEGRWKWKQCGYLRVQTALGTIVNGSVSDADYFYKNSKLEKYLVCLSYNNASDGEFVLATAGIGYCFSIPGLSLSLAPVVGFSFRQLGLVVTGGYLAYAYRFNRPEWERDCLYDDLHSTLRNRWVSPWIGTDLEWNPFPRFDVRGKFEVHFVLLSTTKDWNLRPLYYTQRTAGIGAVTEIMLLYSLSLRQGIGLKIGCDILHTLALDTTFCFADEDHPSGQGVTVPAPQGYCHFKNIVLGVVYDKTF